jgi:hypothetical protein
MIKPYPIRQTAIAPANPNATVCPHGNLAGPMNPQGAVVDRTSNKFDFSMIFILAFFAGVALVMVRYA